ncbi:alpha-D-ribose 1-methylphosphonate 5-triphosphate diphosphatase [Desulfoscipio gibsoniae]
MKKTTLLITNGRVVLPDRVLDAAEIYMEEGIIQQVGKRTNINDARTADTVIDADGGYILPGLVDLHSDAIEKELEPRPGTFFDIAPAFSELEKKLAGQGITTMFHSFSFAGAEYGVRNDAEAAAAIRQIAAMVGYRSLIRNRIHLRFEITNYRCLDIVMSLLADRLVHLLSFMDHTPGQGQYPTLEDYRRYMEKTYHLPYSAIEDNIALKEKGRAMAHGCVEKLGSAAGKASIPIASHDDDSPGRVAYYRGLGAAINEFPINLETARAAHRSGNYVCVGAPNIVRGGSTGRGMRAADAIEAGLAGVICSDYYPPAMLQSVFVLADSMLSLPEAARLVTLEPARAVGLDRLGSLEEGKWGDAVVVNMRGDVPVVTRTVVGGVQVYGVNYRRSITEGLQSENCRFCHQC